MVQNTEAREDGVEVVFHEVRIAGRDQGQHLGAGVSLGALHLGGTPLAQIVQVSQGAQLLVLRLGEPGLLPGRRLLDGHLALGAGFEQVRAGLVSLGWQARDADQAIAAVEPELLASAAADGAGANGAAANGAGADAPPEDGQVDVSVALRAALRVLGRT